MISFNIFCTTLGRPTLPRLIDSLINQLDENDYLTIVSDNNHEFVQSTLNNYTFKCKLTYIKNENGPSGGYGHALINEHINNLPGDFIMFADDDDRYVENAFEIIKKTAIDKNKLYVFKHKWYGTICWNVKDFTLGNVGKCMCSIPNTHDLPKFRVDVLGDVYFYQEIGNKFESEFIDYIIYKVRDTE